MKQKLLKLCAFAAFLILGQLNVSAQTIGDYRSKASGNFTSLDTWETYRGKDSLWVALQDVYRGEVLPKGVGVPGGTSKMTIRNGHTVAIDGGTKSVRATYIEAGATLGTDATTRNLRLVDTIMNNGTFGGAAAGARLSIEGYKVSGTMYIGGTGTYLVGLIRTNGVVKDVDLVIDADINISQYLTGPYTMTSVGSNSTYQYDDRVNIIINAGKTVTFSASGTYLHSNATSIATVGIPYGNYTYTINGTLDMSLSGTSAIIEKQDTASVTTLNVNGILKLGGGFRTASNAATAPLGIVKLNIGNNGIVDATAKAVGTNLVMTNAATNLYSFFNITGNGIVRQNPSLPTGSNPSGAIFRVGSNDKYSPIEFNKEVNAAIDVNVQDVNAGSKKMVKKVWTITSALSDLTTITSLKFGSLSADGANGFNTTDPVSVYNWNGTTWNAGTTATVTGDGTTATPLTAAITTVSALGKFSVANETPVILPLKFISVNAKINATGKQALINWKTAEEKNTLDFVIEKSNDGVNFNQIGVVGAKSTSGLNNYSFTDNNVDAGTSYYRIKQRDNDGASTISTVVSVKSKNQMVVTAYPNPTVSDLNIAYPLIVKGGKVVVYNLAGNKVLEQSLAAGSTSTTVGVTQLVPSVYILEVNTGTDTAVSRFVKQ